MMHPNNVFLAPLDGSLTDMLLHQLVVGATEFLLQLTMDHCHLLESLQRCWFLDAHCFRNVLALLLVKLFFVDTGSFFGGGRSNGKEYGLLEANRIVGVTTEASFIVKNITHITLTSLPSVPGVFIARKHLLKPPVQAYRENMWIRPKKVLSPGKKLLFYYRF